LGVIMHRSAKLSRQCVEAEKEANNMKETSKQSRGYNTEVAQMHRPQLEYYIGLHYRLSLPETGHGKTEESVNKS